MKPPADPVLHEILKEGLLFSFPDSRDEARYVAQHIADQDGAIKGVYPMGKKYAVRIYFCGTQFVFGHYDDAHVACRIHDAAIEHFWEYRRRKSESIQRKDAWFNFSKEEAESDLVNVQGLQAWLYKIERHLVETKQIVHRKEAEAIASQRKKEVIQQSNMKRTARWEILQNVAGVLERIDRMEKNLEKLINELKD